MATEILKIFEAHGLLGLVVGALVVFVLLVLLELRRQGKMHIKFIENILSDAKAERKETNDRFAQSTDKLSDALKELTENLKNR